MRQGPIPRFLHGAIEYVVGVLFIAAPFLFGFDTDAATTVSIAVGLVLLVVAAMTQGPSSLVDSISLFVHVLFDYALVALLIAAPFVFDFSEEAAPTAFFITLGIAHLLLSIGTQFRPAKG
jgi:hypothetical protein